VALALRSVLSLGAGLSALGFLRRLSVLWHYDQRTLISLINLTINYDINYDDVSGIDTEW
jgi:hypothetical protein